MSGEPYPKTGSHLTLRALTGGVVIGMSSYQQVVAHALDLTDKCMYLKMLQTT